MMAPTEPDGPWKLPEPWTPRTRPPLLGKPTARVSHSFHRPSSSSRIDMRSDRKQGESDVPSVTLIRCKRCCRTSVNDQPGRSESPKPCRDNLIKHPIERGKRC